MNERRSFASGIVNQNSFHIFGGLQYNHSSETWQRLQSSEIIDEKGLVVKGLLEALYEVILKRGTVANHILAINKFLLDTMQPEKISG